MSASPTRPIMFGALVTALSCTVAGHAQQNFYGFPHTAQGAAVLGDDGSGNLVVSNIGSSGKDGVRVDLGDTNGFSFGFDPGPSGLLLPGAMVCATLGNPEFDDYVHLGMEETNGGQAALYLDLLSISPQCVHVTLRNGGTEVDSAVFTLPLPPALVIGDFGSGPGGEPMSYNISPRKRKISVDCLIRTPQPTNAAITGSPVGPVLADEVIISCEGLPPDLYHVGRVGLVLSNLPGGQLPVSGEWLHLNTGDPPLGTDYFVTNLGSSGLDGVCGIDICAGCPECCDPPVVDPYDSVCGVSVSNLGSSGEDGVRFECRPWGSPWFYQDDLTFKMSPIDPSPQGSGLVLRAEGEFAGIPGSPLGQCQFHGSGGGAVEVFADFSAIGSVDVIVEVWDDDVLQRSGVVPGGFLGVMTPVGGAIGISKCGKILPDPPCFFICTEDQISFPVDGHAAIGNGLRILAADADGTIGEITAFDIAGQNLPPFITTPARLVDLDPAVVSGGIEHEDIGGASADLDPATGHLVISNIGSSGKDGVSINLGETDGTALRGDWNVDSFFDITYDIYDDQCPTCPDGLVARATVQQEQSPPNGNYTATFVFTATGSDGPGTPVATMTLQDDTGQVLASFPVSPDGEPVVLSSQPGQTKHVVKFKAGADLSKKVNFRAGDSGRGVPAPPASQAMVTNFTQLPSGAGLSVTHPVHGTFDNVSSIYVSVPDSSPDLSSINRACVMASSIQGSPPASFTIEETRLLLYGLEHGAVGNALPYSDFCGDQATLWVANLGSSGLDGVRVDYRDTDSDDDGVLDTDEIVGSSFVLGGTNSQDDSSISTFSWRQLGGAGGTPNTEISRVDFVPSAALPIDSRTILKSYFEAGTMDVQIFDEFGVLVDEELLVVFGFVVTIDSARLPGSYEFELIVVDSPLTTSVTGVQHRFVWDSPVDMTIPGHSIQTGKELRITAHSAGPPTEVTLEGSEILASGDGLSPAAYGVFEEGVMIAGPPNCPEDLAPPAGVEQQDLNAVLNRWGDPDCLPAGAAFPCPEDLATPDGVEQQDLNAVLNRWGDPQCVPPVLQGGIVESPRRTPAATGRLSR